MPRTAFTRGAPVMVEIMGYVTWSSMMSGLRSQRETMMTWVSLRSGVASSGRCIMAQAPQRQAMPTRANTRNLFLTEKLMTRLIIGASRAVESSGTPPLMLRIIGGGGLFFRMLIRLLLGAGNHLRNRAHALF